MSVFTLLPICEKVDVTKRIRASGVWAGFLLSMPVPLLLDVILLYTEVLPTPLKEPRWLTPVLCYFWPWENGCGDLAAIAFLGVAVALAPILAYVRSDEQDGLVYSFSFVSCFAIGWVGTNIASFGILVFLQILVRGFA